MPTMEQAARIDGRLNMTVPFVRDAKNELLGGRFQSSAVETAEQALWSILKRHEEIQDYLITKFSMKNSISLDRGRMHCKGPGYIGADATGPLCRNAALLALFRRGIRVGRRRGRGSGGIA